MKKALSSLREAYKGMLGSEKLIKSHIKTKRGSF